MKPHPFHTPASPRRQLRRSACQAGTCALLLVSAGSLHAVTETWDGGGANNNVSTGANWADNTAPSGAVANNINFAGTTRLTPVVDESSSWNSLTFSPGAGAFNVQADAGLVVGTGGILNQSSLNQTIEHVFSKDTTLNGGTGTLTIGTLRGLSTEFNGPENLVAAVQGNVVINNFVASFGTITLGSGTLSVSETDPCFLAFTVNGGTLRTLAPFISNENYSEFGVQSVIAINAGSFLPAENFSLRGGEMTRANGAVFNMPAGKTFAVQQQAKATFTGSFSPAAASITSIEGGVLFGASRLEATNFISIGNGASLSAVTGGEVAAGSYLDVGNGSAGTMTAADGLTTITASAISDWGRNGTGTVTFSNGATGTFDTVRIAGSGLGASHGNALVQTDADLTTGPLQIGTSGAAGATGVLTVNGAGSTVSQTGASALTIGANAGSTGLLNVDAGGTFSTATGASSVLTTGAIELTGSSTLNVNGNLTMNGGYLSVGLAAGGGVNLAAGRTLRAQSGGDVTFAGSYLLSNAATIQVNGAGSTFRSTGSSLAFRGGSAVTVEAGAQMSASSYIDVGNGGDATLIVDGASLNAGGTSDWGNQGGTAQVTLRNGAVATLNTLRLANSSAGSAGTLAVQSGADLTSGQISAGTSALAGSAVITVTGAGSSILQSGAATFTLGAAANTNAALEVGAGAIFGAGTGLTTIAPTGAVTMSGGLMNIRGPLAHSGQIAANAGTLTVAGSAALAGGVSAGPGGTIQFNGTTTGTAQFSGTGQINFAGSYAPGAAPGAIATVAFQPGVAFLPANTLTMEIAGPASMDKLTFANSPVHPIVWGGNLVVSPAGGFQPQNGQSFDLFDFVPAGATGAFSNISLPFLPPELFWRTDRLYTEGVIFVSNTAPTWTEFQNNHNLDGFNSDRDGDGISDGLEFLLGTDPKVPGHGEGPLVRLNVLETPAQTMVSVYFDMPEWPGLDAHYVIKASSNLTKWNTITQKTGAGAWTGSAGVTVSPAGPGMVRVTVAETLPPGTARRFHRLESEEPLP